MNSIVYKAICLPMNSTVVAIKAIDLDRSKYDFEDILRREGETMSRLFHPNILKAHCTFTVDRRLWVVMPFMSGGSLQSIMSSSFPDGLPGPCIAIVLKETLKALVYLHEHGHLHKGIKPGNILIDSNGSVKLSDFGVSSSIYDPYFVVGSSSLLFGIYGMPYWMPLEVIYGGPGQSLKGDIWSFGVTALELAHGRPPLSLLPPSKSLIIKVKERFRIRFCEYEYEKNHNRKNNFSDSFRDMVESCLDQDPSERAFAYNLMKLSERASAYNLMKLSMFENTINGSDFVVENVLQVGECENMGETKIVEWAFNVKTTLVTSCMAIDWNLLQRQ
ncbi:hypothetical protein F0562_007243 [Nyssa sinensis]|uniref:Protein kinase domain-containing protein n=1 Tax=Nyssa sinensis TaxID=561372 RepID=A0A5J5A4N6_9ASTE|nr:hypothetical protein F0562_007243 [Nyssa sinensis]